MIAIVRWTPDGAILQATQARWEAALAQLSRTGQTSVGRALSIGLAQAEGPPHARRVTVPAEAARAILRLGG